MKHTLGPARYTVIDLEMTGLSAKNDKVIEIGAVRFEDEKQVEALSCFVNPHMSIPTRVVELTGITDEMVQTNGKEEKDAISALLDFIGDDVIVGHNVNFDYSFLKQWAVNNKIALELKACDTLKIARFLLPDIESKKLESLCEHYQIERIHAHRALDDTYETGILFEHLKEECRKRMEEGKILSDVAEKLFEPKVLQYKAKRQTPVTPHQVKQIKEFRAKHAIEDTINWENLTRNEASRIMDQYYSTYGRS